MNPCASYLGVTPAVTMSIASIESVVRDAAMTKGNERRVFSQAAYT